MATGRSSTNPPEQTAGLATMGALTEAEVRSISQLQRREAMERLTGHFTWLEFGDERRPSILRHVHQNFVYDVAQFTWTRGFAWSDVICAATMAKDIFPQLNGVDIVGQLNLLSEALAQRLPDLTPLQRGQLGWYLADTCVGSHRLLAAVASPAAAANVTTVQGHLEVQVPPTPLPLAQGMTLEEAELQRQEAELTATPGCTEHQAPLSDGRTAEVNVSGLLDMEGVQEWVRVAARQVTASLHQDAALFAEVLEPKLQTATSAARGSRSPAATPPRRATAKQTRQAPPGGKGKKK